VNTFYTSLLACISFQDDAHSIASESYTRPDTEKLPMATEAFWIAVCGVRMPGSGVF